MKTLHLTLLLTAVLGIPRWSFSQLQPLRSMPERTPSKNSFHPPSSHPGCGFDELLEDMPDPARRRQERLEKQLHRMLQNDPNRFQQRSATYTVPVVVHIVHDNGDENIPASVVEQGIEHLNDAFANIGYYDQGSGADVSIEFCLARQDPDGNITNGITRTVSPLTVLDKDNEDQALKDLVRWDPLCYVNIWLVREIEGSVAGYAYLPGAHGASFDGIVCEYRYLGSSPANSAISVHEMGHYFGLFHTFQGGCENGDCTLDGDRVCDTPPDASTAAVPCDNPANTCNTDVNSGFATDQDDMNENYMDYGSRFCQHDFTQGQADRMQFFLTGTRSSLLDCSSCLDPCPVDISVEASPNPLPVPVGSAATVSLDEDFAQYFRWFRGDSLVSTSPTLDLPLTELGEFELVLEVSNDNADCFAYDTLLVQPFCDTPAQIEAAQDALEVTAGELVSLTGTAANVDSVIWRLNGSEIGSGLPLDYTFMELGEKQLILEGTTPYPDCNARDTVWVQVVCPDGVSVELGTDYQLVQLNDTVDFFSNAMNVEGVEWTLDGVPVGDMEDLTYVFDQFGVYDLVVEGTSTIPECSAFDAMQVEVECGQQLLAAADEDFIFVGDTINFAGGGSQVQSYEWYVDGQLVSTQASFGYIFEQAGVYEVYLIGEFNICEKRSRSIIITVEEPCFYDTLDVAFEYDNNLDPLDMVKSAADDGYLLVFPSELVKVNGDYEPVWTQSFGEEVVLMGGTANRADEGYFLTYFGAPDIRTKVMQIDENGGVIWRTGMQIFANFNYPSTAGISSAPDGRCLLYERIDFLSAAGGSERYTYLLALDDAGTQLWSTEIGGFNVSEAKYTSDGGVLAVGHSADFSNLLSLVKLDNSGEIVWSTGFTPQSGNLASLGPSYIEEFEDGSYFIAFNAQLAGELYGQGHFLHLSAEGELLSARRLYDNGLPQAVQVITAVDQALNGDFLLALTLSGQGVAQLESDIVRIRQDESVRWSRKNAIKAHAARRFQQAEEGEIAVFGGLNQSNLLYLVDDRGFSGNCEMQARQMRAPLRNLVQAFGLYNQEATLEYGLVPEPDPREGSTERPVICSVEGINAIDAKVDLLSASACGDSLTLTAEVCNVGNLPIPADLPLVFYDGPPFEAGADLVDSLQVGTVIEADSCKTLSFTLFNDFGGQAVLMFNDDGAADLPFNFLQDFPRTAEDECNFYNNLDSLNLENLPVEEVPPLELGADTVLCAGDSLLLRASPGFALFEWQDGSTADSLWAAGPGTYSLRASLSCGGAARDTLVVEAPDSLSLELGPDLSGCQNEIFDLNAGSGFETYRWQDNSFDSLFTAFEAGTYWVETTDQCGNVYRDTVAITLDPSYNLELGAPVSICPGDSVSFDIQTSHTDYRWYPGEPSVSCETCPDATLRPDSTTKYVFVAEDAECFSSDTLTVNVLPTFSIADTVQICLGDTVEVFGQPVSSAGTFEQSFNSSVGCDSTVQVTVELLPELQTSAEQTICAGESAVLFGDTVQTAGTYSEAYLSANGCDSTHTINLSVLDTFFTSESIQVCAGESVSIFGNPVSEAGTYQAALQAANGCDSVHQIELSVVDSISTQSERTICQGETTEIFGQTIDQAGTYTQAFEAASGCDSLHTVAVEVLDTAATFASETICQGDSTLVFGSWLAEPGLYSETFSTAAGCDSTHTIEVTVLDTIATAANPVICEGDSVSIFGELIAEPGIYTQVFTAANGCDSTHRVRLDVQPASSTMLSLEQCAGDSSLIFGNYETAPGTYEQVFVNQFGCDSVVMVALSVAEPPSLQASVEPACPEAPNGSLTVQASGGAPPLDYSWAHTSANTNSLSALAAGTYTLTATDQNGCSAILQAEVPEAAAPDFSLEVRPITCSGGSSGQISVAGSESLVYSLDGQSFMADTLFSGLAPGNYTVYAQSPNGCVASRSVGLDPVPAVELELVGELKLELGDSVQLMPQGDLNAFSSFAWSPPLGLSCSDCLQPFASPETSQLYQLVATDTLGCSAAAEVRIVVSQDRAVYLPNVFSPNEDGRNDAFLPLSDRDYQVVAFQVFDRWGGLLHEEEDTSLQMLRGWDGKKRGETMKAGVFVYQLVLQIGGREEVFTGDVLLLR